MQALRVCDRNELSSGTRPARHAFRLLTRIRTCYDGAVMYDIQLQSIGTGRLIWAHSFSHEHEAERYRTDVESDLEVLDETEFRRKWRLLPNL
jgi:hypothetical protein